MAQKGTKAGDTLDFIPGHIAQRLVYSMKTVHTVQSFLDTFCQNGLQFRIIFA